MKTAPHTLRPRAAWLLLAAPALLVTPAFAQDATPAAPPPVRSTVPQATAPATPPPAATPAPAPAPRPAASAPADGASRTVLSPEAQAALAEAQERPAARPARAAPARQATRTTTARSTTTQSAPAPAPVAPAPAPAPVTPAPEAAAPATEVDAPAPIVDAPVTETADTTTTEPSGPPLWPLALIVIAILAVGAVFFMRSRRKNAAFDGQYEPEADYYAEPAPAPTAAYVEPTPAAAPAYVGPAAVAAGVAPALVRDEEPVTATEEATIVEAEAEEVAALTDTSAPARNRPWLEFAMRPVRAGTSIDEALVEIELTVANSGSVAAQDVRVSAFMLTDANAGEMERMMIDPPADGSVDPVTIEPGEGTRIDATLAALKSDVGEAGEFTPVVVADARYRLPDGSEGRTSASFVVGISREGGTLTPIDLADRVMRDDIEARLHGEPQHA